MKDNRGNHVLYHLDDRGRTVKVEYADSDTYLLPYPLTTG